MPSAAAFQKLTEMLKQIHSQDTPGVTDLIWGPDLQVFDLPLDGDGQVLNEHVSAQELSEALQIVKQKRGKHESN